ncbi:MAG TPA: YetF domain-containing protein [Anaerolineales bacterium]
MELKTLNDMFILSLPVLEKILRPVIIYAFLIAGLRIAGKRELAQLNPFDLVVLLTLSNTVQNAIIGEDNSVTGGVIGAATLLAVNYLVVRFLFRHDKLDHLVEGDTDVLVENGVINKQHLERELITLPELETAAHKQGFSSLSEIERATIEPGGVISFTGRRPAPELERHQDILARIDRLTEEIDALRISLGNRSSDPE